MAKHMVKCAVCGESFDLNKEQGVRHGTRRYAHLRCFKDGELVPMEVSKEDPELTALKDYINNLLGKNANWAMITKQIKNYKEEKEYSYSGMLKTLQYFYEIKRNKLDPSTNTIGIIPFCYQEALNYQYSIWLANHKNETNNFVAKEEVIHIPVPKKKKLFSSKFNFLDSEVEDGE